MNFIKSFLQSFRAKPKEQKKIKEEIPLEKEKEKEEEKEKVLLWIQQLREKENLENKMIEKNIVKLISDMLFPHKKLKSTLANIFEIKQYINDKNISERTFKYDIYEFPLNYFIMMLYWQQESFPLKKEVGYYIPSMVATHLYSIYESTEQYKELDKLLKKIKKKTVFQKLDLKYKEYGEIEIKFIYTDKKTQQQDRKKVNIDLNVDPEITSLQLDFFVNEIYEQNEEITRCICQLGLYSKDFGHASGLFYEIRNEKMFVSIYDPHGKNTNPLTTIDELEVYKVLNPLFEKLAQKYKKDGKITSSFIFYNSAEKYYTRVIGIQKKIEMYDLGLCVEISYLWLFFMQAFSIQLELENSYKSIGEYMFAMEKHLDNKYTTKEVYQLLLDLFTHLYVDYFQRVSIDNPGFEKLMDKAVEYTKKYYYKDEEEEFKKMEKGERTDKFFQEDWDKRFTELIKTAEKQEKEDIEKKRYLSREEEAKLKKQKKYREYEKYETQIEKEDVGERKKIGEECLTNDDCNTDCCFQDVADENIKVCSLKEVCAKKRQTRSQKKDK